MADNSVSASIGYRVYGFSHVNQPRYRPHRNSVVHGDDDGFLRFPVENTLNSDFFSSHFLNTSKNICSIKFNLNILILAYEIIFTKIFFLFLHILIFFMEGSNKIIYRFHSAPLSAKILTCNDGKTAKFKVNFPDDLEWKITDTAKGLKGKHKTMKTANGLWLFVLPKVKTVDEESDKELLNKAIAKVIRVKSADTLFSGSTENMPYVNYDGKGTLADKTKKAVEFAVWAYQPKKDIAAVLVVWSVAGKLDDVKNGMMNVVVPSK